MLKNRSISLTTDAGVETVLEAPQEVIAVIQNFYELLTPDSGEYLRVLVHNKGFYGGTFINFVPGDGWYFDFDPYWSEQNPLDREYFEVMRSDLHDEFSESRTLEFEIYYKNLWRPSNISEDAKTTYDVFWRLSEAEEK